MQQIIEEYFSALGDTYRQKATEHSGRTALQNLMNALKPDGISVQHESGREGDKGAPDFKIIRAGQALGYVENKAPDVNLDKVLKSNQIKRYTALSDNLIVTNYLQWIWLREGKVIARETLGYESDLQDRQFKPDQNKIAELEKMLDGFFSVDPDPIVDPETLAEQLAIRAQYLRDDLTDELVRQQKDDTGGKLIGLYEVFRDSVFHALTTKEFADAFAQMLAYSLFLARLNAGANQEIDLTNVKGFIPTSFSLIRELSDFLDEMQNPEYAQVKWVIDEILSLINGLDLAEILNALSFQGRKVRRGVKARDEDEARLFERDPYIYFYEDFLEKYDPKTKETRGVYYTPPPVVSFIVRAIDDILKDTFDIQKGLGDEKKVTVLDFACGTGTFLVEVMEQIFANIGKDSGAAGLVVSDHILKKIYGFEFLLAPYTIAHLKLSQYLVDKGHPLKSDERLGVYLTNTLEPITPKREAFLPALSNEVELAQKVKDKQILVITGNPPYSGHSKNKGKWISKAIDAYKQVDGKPLGEKNSKWLNDDYVKFIRFAQMKMDGGEYDVEADDGSIASRKIEGVDEGVVGIITNHSFIDNPTFRGMRQSLMKSFDAIYVLDLHGNTKKKEVSPDGSVDQNVFDIQQGVAITLFVKGGKAKEDAVAKRTDCHVYHADLWGKRLDKYKASAEATMQSVDWEKIDPISPLYMFCPFDGNGFIDYLDHWPLHDTWNNNEPKQIMLVDVLGFQTHRDPFAIGHNKSIIDKRIEDAINNSLTNKFFTEKYFPGPKKDTLEKRKKRISKSILLREKIADLDNVEDPKLVCTYRPFDKRWSFYSNSVMDRPRNELIENVVGRDNLQLLVPRQLGTRSWRHVLIADSVAESCVISDKSKEGNYNFPLWLYPPEDVPRVENLSEDFRTWIDEKYDDHFTAEEIMAFIYGVLHAPEYREKYAEFLRIDFPRIPFPEKAKDFHSLAKLGQKLIDVHLMHDVPQLGLGDYKGKGEHLVEKPVYAEAHDRLYINKDQYFENVPRQVWEFHIGGYQVLDKYLKSRKARNLVLDEVNNITNICNVLAFTITQMQAIDRTFKKAFPQAKKEK